MKYPPRVRTQAQKKTFDYYHSIYLKTFGHVPPTIHHMLGHLSEMMSTLETLEKQTKKGTTYQSSSGATKKKPEVVEVRELRKKILALEKDLGFCEQPEKELTDKTDLGGLEKLMNYTPPKE